MKNEAENTKEIIKNVAENPLGETSPINLSNDLALGILKNGGHTIDKTGTPFDGADEIIENAMNEITDCFNVTPGAEAEIKKYGFTEKEVKLIKNIEPRKPFHLNRIKHITFIKTGDNLLLTADEYLRRLESGIIKLNKENEELTEFNSQFNVFTTGSFFDKVKYALKLVFKGVDNGQEENE